MKGKVVKLDHGPVNTEVNLQLPGGETIVAVITTEAADNLGLENGKEAYAVIKASSIMVGVD